MKKKLSGFGISLIVAAAVAITAFVPPQNDKSNKDQKTQNQGKSNQGKGNQPQDKGNQGNQKDKDNKGKNDANPKRGNDGVINQGNDQDVNDQGNNKGKAKRIKNEKDYGYEWSPETFKDRNNIRKNEKVTICHKFNRGDEDPVTITVSSNAMKAHMNHGDVMGTCPAVSNRPYSDIFGRKRTDYYNTIYRGEDQVVYSQSILDYALQRLAASRLQLAQYQASNMAPVEIERKQATVVELEQNVSLLEALLVTAAELLVPRLF